MDSRTALPKRARLNPYGKALRRERIFARLRGGWAYDEIAREERVTPRRVRQIVSEALQRRQVDDGSDHAMLQHARLEKALRLAAEAVAEGEIGAIAPYLKVLAQLDRYQGAASAKQAYDEKARERLFAKINRVAARLAACRTEVCGWSSDGFLRFAAAVDAQSGFVGVRLSLLDRRWSWIDGAPGRAALNRRGRGRTIAWCSR